MITKTLPVIASCQYFDHYRPGSYDHELNRNRHVIWQEAFGVTPVNLPQVKVHSTIDKNTEKVRVGYYNIMTCMSGGE